jgi:hypothetical protein
MTISTVSCEKTSFSDGQFPIDRAFWEQQLIRLFEAYAPVRDNAWREYGVDFENEVFYVHYDRQDYDCDCHLKDELTAWEQANPHTMFCFRSIVDPVEKMFHDRLPKFNFFSKPSIESMCFMTGLKPTAAQLEEDRAADEKWQQERKAYRMAYKIYEKKLKKLVTDTQRHFKLKWKYSWDIEWRYACTCGVNDRHNAYEKSQVHVRPCNRWWAEQPNFLHKPSEYGVHWYKYPCRDGYGTLAMTYEQLTSIIDDCIKSLK